MCIRKLSFLLQNLFNNGSFRNKLKSNSSLFDKDAEEAKKRIIQLFLTKVKGKTDDISGANVNHDGKSGHWLETQMGIPHNASNTPDLYGFEMKNQTSSGKTTFGDWSPDYTPFKKNKLMSREDFLKIFGSPNVEKNNRYSWSGKSCPKLNVYNESGQIMKVDNVGNIFALYYFSHDKRPDKQNIVPVAIQIEGFIVAKWSAEKMKINVEKKFNDKGWFKCYKNTDGLYDKIVFGPPINFDIWIEGVRSGVIFFDSGMYAGNDRPYSQWRANNQYWDSLITERY